MLCPAPPLRTASGLDGQRRDGGTPPTTWVLLHLGVAHTAAEYRLESRAYNCAAFRVPDERGWQPEAHELEPGCGLEAWVGSRLPLVALCGALADKGHNVVVSEDAGRFICNWTYHRACRLAEKAASGGAGYIAAHALFVHVPPFTVYGEELQRSFLIDVMKAIAECVALGR
ncbi:hypothetical protein GPECTOR_23g14 [Gonium pectorale]|uniref:Uncharacterized protein n=1 Tax=Gonium pectorale TaxID=33097 RepID=A0A150GGV3_GONPE|nr:hypothetical protein GPECTOR_23g14 [Gonium pectorale]|eukprot:KXZ49054.1 hypothetical protein GPECTOR_23g14 [Gonium pectorale]